MKSGEVYRILTYQFLHSDLAHISFNMIGILIIGSSLERYIGSLKYSILYLISGYCIFILFYFLLFLFYFILLYNLNFSLRKYLLS
jgi:rhomboid protease GluP